MLGRPGTVRGRVRASAGATSDEVRDEAEAEAAVGDLFEVREVGEVVVVRLEVVRLQAREPAWVRVRVRG